MEKAGVRVEPYSEFWVFAGLGGHRPLKSNLEAFIIQEPSQTPPWFSFSSFIYVREVKDRFLAVVIFNVSCEKDLAHPMSRFSSRSGRAGFKCTEGETCLTEAMPHGRSASPPPGLTFASTP